MRYVPPDPTLDWPIPYPAVELIAEVEGLSLTAYQDVAGIWTIGRGQTSGVRGGMKWTLELADRDLCADLKARVAAFHAKARRAWRAGNEEYLRSGVNAEPPVTFSGNELGAMVSLAYNIGLKAFFQSSVWKAHVRGDKTAAARAFGLYNKAWVGGKFVEVRGLVRRRAREAALYLTPDADLVALRSQGELSPRGDSPDGAPESRAVASPLFQGGTVSAVSGAVGVAAAMSNDVRQVAENMGVNVALVVGAVALGVGVLVLVQRWRQRRGGWA